MGDTRGTRTPDRDDARGRPVVDVTRVVTTAEVVLGAVLVAHWLSRRPVAPTAKVTMGPGGWVSMKGGVVAVRPRRRGRSRRRPGPGRRPVLSADSPPVRRPWWARLLGAVPLERLAR